MPIMDDNKSQGELLRQLAKLGGLVLAAATEEIERRRAAGEPLGPDDTFEVSIGLFARDFDLGDD